MIFPKRRNDTDGTVCSRRSHLPFRDAFLAVVFVINAVGIVDFAAVVSTMISITIAFVVVVLDIVCRDDLLGIWRDEAFPFTQAFEAKRCYKEYATILEYELMEMDIE